MITTRDPETMTADERSLEVASILAAGLLRRVRQAKAGNARPISPLGPSTHTPPPDP